VATIWRFRSTNFIRYWPPPPPTPLLEKYDIISKAALPDACNIKNSRLRRIIRVKLIFQNVENYYIIIITIINNDLLDQRAYSCNIQFIKRGNII